MLNALTKSFNLLPYKSSEGESVEKVVVSILEIPTLSGAGCGRQKSRGRFNKHRKITSDFDKEVRKMLEQSGHE